MTQGRRRLAGPGGRRPDQDPPRFRAGLPAALADRRRFVANAREFIAHKEDYCACACVRLGIGATLLSMGIEAFSYAMADDPQLIADVHDAYADWTAAVVPVLEEIGFDVIWAFDDVAFNSGPMFSPAFYREHILPKEKAVAATFTRPLITHSDGNMTPLLDAWLELGQQAIHPIQPDVMDIDCVKRQYGRRVALVGNIFMSDLVHKHARRDRGPGPRADRDDRRRRRLHHFLQQQPDRRHEAGERARHARRDPQVRQARRPVPTPPGPRRRSAERIRRPSSRKETLP